MIEIVNTYKIYININEIFHFKEYIISIININKYQFDHNIATDNGSSGCPILLLNSNINLRKRLVTTIITYIFLKVQRFLLFYE